MAFPKSIHFAPETHVQLVSDGIVIEHVIHDYSSSIAFQCFYYGRLKSELEKRGYVVS